MLSTRRAATGGGEGQGSAEARGRHGASRCASSGGNQHFTQPPARFTEASLIKTLEENGIGRPSTYAATITTITSREYVTREGNPSADGASARSSKLMKERFPEIVNVKPTAEVEKASSTRCRAAKPTAETLHDFYDDF